MPRNKRYDDAVRALCEEVQEKGVEVMNDAVKALRDAAGLSEAPVAAVQWVDIEKVKANSYNPNQVAKNELKLLEISIDHDGYTQPVVVVYDEVKDRYVIVDGYHRYTVMRSSEKIRHKYNGKLPVVVLNKSPKERMAATVRHNRARGKHSINGMGQLVVSMLKEGATDEEVCNELGLEADELVRLKHMTGVAALFKDREYGKSWKTTTQMKEEKKYEKSPKNN